MAAVWQAQLPPGPKYVLQACADHANEDGLHVYPSQQRIAGKTGFGETTVRGHLRWLEDAGLLVEVRAPGGDARTTREYRIDLQVLSALPRVRRPADAADRQEPPPGGNRRYRPADAAGKPSVQPPTASEASPPTPARARDLLWDLFDAECGEVTNAAERGRRNRALGQIRESLGLARVADVTDMHVHEVRTRIRRARATWGGKPVEAHSVAVNWRALGSDASAATLTLDDMARQASQ